MSQPLILPQVIISMLASFAPVFTKPSFQTFCHYIGTLMLGEGRRTGSAVARSLADAKSSGVYARLCSRARWSAPDLLERLWEVVKSVLPWPRDEIKRPIMWAGIDDSVVGKTGNKQPGLAYHFHQDGADPARMRKFLYGHCWVMLGVIWPTVTRALCFPLRAALYVRAKDCDPAAFQDKPALALALLAGLRMPKAVCLRVLVDGAYATASFIMGVRGLGHHIITRLKHNANLCLPAPSPIKKGRGRPRRYGKKVDLASYHTAHSQQAQVQIGQKGYLATYSSVDAIPRRVGVICRIVMVELRNHKRAVLLSTDLTLSPVEIIQAYAMRFSIEIAFRDLKQRFGWGHYQVRSRQAIERHVALSFVAATLTTLLLVQRDDQQTIGQMRRALQQAAVLAWIICTIGKNALRHKIHLLKQFQYPLVGEMAEV
jgi:SRSO17 transposase